MKNKDYEMALNGYNARLAHFDAKKRVIAELLENLNKQYHEAGDEWNTLWRERQRYINEHVESVAV
jgi:hypothetical protein